MKTHQKEALIKKQVEKATKTLMKYVDEFYSNDVILRFVNQGRGTRITSLHDKILDTAKIGRLEFHDAWNILKAHVK